MSSTKSFVIRVRYFHNYVIMNLIFCYESQQRFWLATRRALHLREEKNLVFASRIDVNDPLLITSNWVFCSLFYCETNEGNVKPPSQHCLISFLWFVHVPFVGHRRHIANASVSCGTEDFSDRLVIIVINISWVNCVKSIQIGRQMTCRLSCWY